MRLGVHLRLRDDPRGRVRDAEVEHFARLHELVQALHHLLDRRHVIPKVHVENVNVVRLQQLQRALNRVAQTLCVVAGIVRR